MQGRPSPKYTSHVGQALFSHQNQALPLNWEKTNQSEQTTTTTTTTSGVKNKGSSDTNDR